MPTLLDPVRIGALDLPNRVIMAPLTRARAIGGGRVPNALMARYYEQRASAGLILSEATAVTPQGVGYADTPGLWSDEQVEGWKQVTAAVHAKGGVIFAQLWHVGRISDPSFLNGEAPVAPSAIAAQGHVSLLRPQRPYPVPRALETAELAGIVAAYKKAAENAKKAGFDGVQIHGANGYLLDQFLQDKTNQRTDQYGGPIENRARLMLEVTDAVIDVWGPNRVGMHLAPRRDSHDMGDSNPAETFGYVARELGKRKIAVICAREAVGEDSLGPLLKKEFGGVYIANEKMDKQTAQQALDAGTADAVAFGKAFIANPDLVWRWQNHAPVDEADSATFYGGDARGYTDYPRAGRGATAGRPSAS